MNISLSRRSFLAGLAAAGAFSKTALKVLSAEDGTPDLIVASGKDPVKNAQAVIDAAGGLGSIVKEGQVVGLLPNAQGTHPGTSTNPEIVKLVVELCKKAGAKEVRWFSWLPERSWARTNIKANVDKSGATFVNVDPNDDSLWKEYEIPQGKTLKKIRYFNALYEPDVFISMPIVKDHIGSRFTGSLKNYMGASHPMDNRPFHPTFEGDDILHMEQCIADMNTIVRPPDMIIMDANTILTSNGPFGPGSIASPEKVILGFDRVAIDSYASTVLGLKGEDVHMIRMAHEHGLGEIDLSKLTIKEITT